MRAVAVLLVVLAHSGVSALSGGYVGVDVFFVISGYLITNLMLREHERSGRISLLKFYGRRIRRILPASTFALVTVLVASRIVLGDVSRQIFVDGSWAAGFLANWRFAASGVDYFQQGTPPSPLQHFWSLAVEEQFYFVWPVILIGLLAASRQARQPRRFVSAMLAMGLLGSLGFSYLQTNASPTVAYFSSLTRGWELAAGALLALVGAEVKVDAAASHVLRFTGLVAIAASAIAFDETTQFPGLWALIPVLGTLLVIGAGDSASPAHLLNTRPLQFFGDISYALYLWHWVPLSLWIWTQGVEPSLSIAALMFIVATAVAYASTRFLERPIRDAQLFAGRVVPTYVLGAGLVALSLGVSLLAIPAKSQVVHPPTRPSDWASETAAIAAVRLAVNGESASTFDSTITPALDLAPEDQSQAYADGCILDPEVDTPKVDCIYGDPNGTKTVVLWGDSHAAMWLPAVHLWAKQRHLKLQLLAKAACPASEVAVFSQALGRRFLECERNNQRVLTLVQSSSADTVIITSASGNRDILDASGESITDISEQARTWAAGTSEVVQKLRAYGKRVMVIGDNPYLERNPVFCAAANRDALANCGFDLGEKFLLHSSAEELEVEKSGGQYVDVSDFLCAAGRCPLIIAQRMVYLDQWHVTRTYAEYLAGALGQRLDTKVS